MDIKRLQNQVFERTGIRIDAIDPVFTVVALNETIFEELMAVFLETQTKNIGELDERIGSLVVLHRSLVAAGKDLADRADQAHLNAALKAATEAKTEIMAAAKHAVNVELEKALGVIIGASSEAQQSNRRSWGMAIAQATIGGILSAGIILAGLHLR
jgi:hypothetical protein